MLTMGLDTKITFSADRSPPWPRLAEVMANAGFPLQLRMIDNELAFPDETPTDSWHELRDSTPAGMITLRREEAGTRLAIWVTADEGVLQARDKPATTTAT